MTFKEPTTELNPAYSSDDATATPWAEARERVEEAEVWWLSTVRPDGRPHVTPLMTVWVHDKLYFSTGPQERKNMNLAGNPHVVLTTGSGNVMKEGLDLVVECEAVRVTDDSQLLPVADAIESKYGSGWHYEVRDGAFHHQPGEALVYQVAPETAFAFGRGRFSQTRYRF